MITRFKAIISSDWNECLAPCGPFDFISFNYPDLEPGLRNIFKQYTSNVISLGEATKQLKEILPGTLNQDMMDNYLDNFLMVYPGLPDFIEWCLKKDILFMINTTGVIGYFQRVLAKKLLPKIPVLSAHPLIQYPVSSSDPDLVYELLEIEDKGLNTNKAARYFQIDPKHIALIGDSGGDGPHFEWGAKQGAFCLGSMIKPSLEAYCKNNGISIYYRFGHSYREGEAISRSKEMEYHFSELQPIIQEIFRL